MKFFTILLVPVFLLTSQVFGQNDSPNKVPNRTQEYNSKQLDSMIPLVLKEYYNANYEMVIEQTPNLINQAINLDEAETEKKLISLLGNAFVQLEEYDNAFDIFSKALAKARVAKDTLGILNAHVNLGNTFFTQEPQKAISYFKNGVAYVGITDKHDIPNFILHSNLAELYAGIKKPIKAQFYLDRALRMISKESLKPRLEEYKTTGLFIQSSIHLLNYDYDKAIETSLIVLEKGEGLLDENYILGTYKVLLEAYEKTRQYKKLSEVHTLYDQLIEKRYEAQKIKQQQIASSKFNLERYKQELRTTKLANELSEQKASKNKLLFIFSTILGGVLIVMISILLFTRHKRNGLVKNLREKNQQYLLAKEHSEDLAESNTRFLSTISHELRTPLYGIIGLSSSLLNEQKLVDHGEEIKSLKFSADYLLALVNDVLHINKFESEEGRKLNLEHFQLNTLLKNIVQSFEFNNQKNNNKVSISIHPDISKVLVGDKMKLSQVLMNLISNASKFTEDGTLSIEVDLIQQHENSYELGFSVKDTGAGIPEEEQSKIFKEFTQVKNHQGRDGTGLGLPIVNKILNILESQLSFESALGKGSTFAFNLRLAQGDPQQIMEGHVTAEEQSLKGKKILIVDDNNINQLVTQKVLEQFEMTYETASNGLEAIENMKNGTYDAVLMDINMPGMNGMEASEEIRKFNSKTPIIALTATNYSAIDKELQIYGINDAIVKPYDIESLRQTLAKHIYRLAGNMVKV